MKKIIYILTLLCFLAATFATFAGCESQSAARPVLHVYCTAGCRQCVEESPYVAAIERQGRVSVVHESEDAAAARGIYDFPAYVLTVNGHDTWRGASIMPLYRELCGGR